MTMRPTTVWMPTARSTVTGGGVQVVSPAPRAAWERLYAADPDAIATQSPAWFDSVRAARGYADASRLYRMPDGRELVLPLAAQRLGITLIEESWPHGWGYGGLLAEGGTTDRDAAVVLADLVRRPTVRTAVTPMPLQIAGWEAAAPAQALRVPFTSRVIDLRPGFDAVWRGYRKSARRGVRTAERLGVEVQRASGVDADAVLVTFTRLYGAAIKRWAAQRGQPLRVARLLARLRNVPAQAAAVASAMGEDCVIWSASIDGRPIAVDVMLQSPGHHMSWLGAMDADLARDTAGTYLLQSRIIEDACRRGVRHFHLGESDPGSGVDAFKAGFGAAAVSSIALRFERLPVTATERRLRAGFAMVSEWNNRRAGR
ncbi:GNAT family N-acetyltransferase [Pseudonocardia kunmingensis]|uniref:CelD/BcsL family acetyltransferase involved in cellulose biosynthesis n=1 Tax=Pseudonocardia kunmingensis TaxID=630975 RepID=A0A543DKH8_9PSEU|nr:GNAT family N-acetyltransferase [Pseudonocardia kunmingensis]TQM09840.1 CelD/BcsL family acetyltransferase involved in cellulose biosynthesis [Pseudonocardia kunmingensis]